MPLVRETIPGALVINGPDNLKPVIDAIEFSGVQEQFYIIPLNTRHLPYEPVMISQGTLNASLVHPRDVFRVCLEANAAAFVAAHNHPSGETRPSGDDLELTKRLAKAGDLMGIVMLDHLVVGHEGEMLSIREYGWPEEGC